MPVTIFDIVLLIIMLVSGFLAMLRGLTREVLSIVSWAAAALAALYAYLHYRDFARAYIGHPQLADIVLVAAVFLLVLVIVSLLTMKIGDTVLDSRIGALDRSLGFLFGLARGLILVVIVYLFYSWFFSREAQPPAITDAWTLPLIESTGEVIKDLAEKATEWFNDATTDPNDQAGLLGNTSPSTTGSTRTGSGNAAGYGSGARRGLDQLLESSRGTE